MIMTYESERWEFSIRVPEPLPGHPEFDVTIGNDVEDGVDRAEIEELAEICRLALADHDRRKSALAVDKKGQ